MENPFIYGEAVTGENLCGRDSEIGELLRDVENCQKVLLFSPRRYGKTSLLKDLLLRIDKKKYFTLYVDLYPALTESDFLRALARAFSGEIKGPAEKALNIFRETFRNLMPKLSLKVSQEGEIGLDFSVEKREIAPATQDLLEGIKKYIEKNEKKGLIIFDEFQQINNFETDRIERELRTRIQTHRNIAYIFSGSKRHILLEMFGNPNGPFYKSTKHFPIIKLKEGAIFDFIRKKFSRTGIKIDEDMIRKIIEASECDAYYFQYICHELWEMALPGRKVLSHYPDLAIHKIMERETSNYNNIWDLLTVRQKKVLIGVAKIQPGEKIFSQEFTLKHNLGPVSSLQRIIKGLVKKELVDKAKANGNYEILDIIFKKWIQKIYV